MTDTTRSATGINSGDPTRPRPLEGLAFNDQPWAVDALCAQVDPEIFFPDKGESTREPKQVCAACPVRNECLRYALDTDQRFGVYGGLSERERRKVKRLLRLRRKGAVA